MTTAEHPPGWENCKDNFYTYTRPRGPIAAMYSSPGPCYQLPTLVGQKDHDYRSVHNKNPAWAFGVRHGKFRDDCSPGPCYLPNAKIYRDGMDGTPAYSLYGRNRDLNAFAVPGPGAYSPECTGPTGKRMPPSYSFGTRHRARRSDQTPGPDRYTLDSMMGPTIQSGKKQAPCHTVRGRSKIGGFSEDLSKTPGPKYDVVSTGVYRHKPPQYSMTSRNVMPGDSTQKPGPGAHSPEKVYVHKRSAPAPSFGMRHSQYIAVPVMEPSDY
ncbi:ciliary microtubule associated protein 1A-like [Babylonia areolata]|uniref:ciliary microtubule associated protein 1A-like n=1 Tax=Babylonia areolata TaxID=304850 RepID=UPI003FD33032